MIAVLCGAKKFIVWKAETHCFSSTRHNGCARGAIRRAGALLIQPTRLELRVEPSEQPSDGESGRGQRAWLLSMWATTQRRASCAVPGNAGAAPASADASP